MFVLCYLLVPYLLSDVLSKQVRLIPVWTKAKIRNDSALRPSLCCLIAAESPTLAGHSKVHPLNCWDWPEQTVLAMGADRVSNHGSDIFTRFYIHRNDISTSADDVSTEGSTVFAHICRLWLQQWPSVITSSQYWTLLGHFRHISSCFSFHWISAQLFRTEEQNALWTGLLLF